MKQHVNNTHNIVQLKNTHRAEQTVYLCARDLTLARVDDPDHSCVVTIDTSEHGYGEELAQHQKPYNNVRHVTPMILHNLKSHYCNSQLFVGSRSRDLIKVR